jgi:proline dehydrogenase
VIKATLFDQFCGGETLDDCRTTIDALARFKIGAILDYSVEAGEREKDFDAAQVELTRVIEAAAADPRIRFAGFKVTGLARPQLLAKVSAGERLTTAEKAEMTRAEARVFSLCRVAAQRGVRIMIDAEETWIQDAIDALALTMMREYNRDGAGPIVYNTVQLYRRDRLAYMRHMQALAEREGFRLGFKLVRGAYMEKERAYAEERGRESPIQPDKQATDAEFDTGLRFAFERLDLISICCGSHNEASNRLLAELVVKHGIGPTDRRVEFAQLYGMSDHLTYNLAHHGFNVSKYVPYGPVRSVLPYLFRRAEENTSIKGQAGRELQLIERELRRRRAAPQGSLISGSSPLR